MTVSLAEQIDSVLSEFENHIPYVQATALFDTDGLVISSRLPGGVDEQKIGAMTAAILSISNRSGEELERGNMKRIRVDCDYERRQRDSAGGAGRAGRQAGNFIL